MLVKFAFIGMAVGGIATLWGAIAADMGASLMVIFNGLRLLHLTGEGGDTRYPSACQSVLTCGCGADPRQM